MKQQTKGRLKTTGELFLAVLIGVIIGVLVLLLMFGFDYSKKSYQQANANAHELEQIENKIDKMNYDAMRTKDDLKRNKKEVRNVRKDLREMEEGKSLVEQDEKYGFYRAN